MIAAIANIVILCCVVFCVERKFSKTVFSGLGWGAWHGSWYSVISETQWEQQSHNRKHSTRVVCTWGDDDDEPLPAIGCSRRVCFSKYIFCLLLIGRSQAKKIKAIFVVFVCRRIYLRLELNGRRIVLLCFKSNGWDRKLCVTQLIQDVCANHSRSAASIFAHEYELTYVLLRWRSRWSRQRGQWWPSPQFIRSLRLPCHDHVKCVRKSRRMTEIDGIYLEQRHTKDISICFLVFAESNTENMIIGWTNFVIVLKRNDSIQSSSEHEIEFGCDWGCVVDTRTPIETEREWVKF